MKTFIVTYETDNLVAGYRTKAKNRGCARAEFRKKFPDLKIISVAESLNEVQKAVAVAVAEGNIKFGVQKSLQLGFSDLPLFQEKNQLDLF